MITVRQAPAYLAVQDLGWPVGRGLGLPPGGAMDRSALQTANLLLGNAAGAAALEWAIGAGTLAFEAPTRLALAGAGGDARLGGSDAPPFTVLEARAGDELRVERLRSGAWLYVCLCGGVSVPPILGSRSTLLTAGFGGHGGRLLRDDDRLPTGRVPDRAPAPGLALPAELRPADEGPIRILAGPQRARFPDSAWDALLAGEYRIAAGSRMGYRLDGPPLAVPGLGDLPSEAAVPGAVQVPPDGLPIALMPDGPTIGGYAKLAVVLAEDVDRLAQRVPGAPVRFEALTLGEAHAHLRAARARLEALTTWVERARR